MTEPYRKSILIDAVKTYGIHNQISQLYEEMGELLTAFSKLKRANDPCNMGEFYVKPTDKNSMKYILAYNNLCSEIADLQICLNQMKIIFCEERIAISEDRKLDRLSEKLQAFHERTRLLNQEDDSEDHY